jgi:hypothetical protein
MLNDECGWKDGDRSAVNLRGETGDKQDDDQLNWLGKTDSPLTPTGLLMEGAILASTSRALSYRQLLNAESSVAHYPLLNLRS